MAFAINLQNLFGDFSSIWVSTTDQGPVQGPGTGYLKPDDDITQLHISDSSNQILMGGLVLDADYIRYMNAMVFPGTYIRAHSVYPLSTSKSVYADLVSGAHSGSLSLTARGETLNILTKSSVPANTVRNLVTVAFHLSALRVNENGTVTVLR